MVKDKTHGDLIVEAASEVGIPCCDRSNPRTVRVWACACQDDNAFYIEEIVERWGNRPNIVGFGAMHCPANEVETFVKQIRSTAGERAFITAYPNQGFFVPPEWKVEKEYSAVEYAELAESWHKAGANAVGGCCGIGPEN